MEPQNNTFNGGIQKTGHFELIVSNLKSSFWVIFGILFFSAFFYFFYAYLITRDISIFRINRFYKLILLLLPFFTIYLVIEFLSIRYTIYNFYRSMFVSTFFSIECAISAWLTWYIFIHPFWTLGAFVFSSTFFCFWYLRTKHKYNQTNLIERCLKNKIIDLDNASIKLKSLREELYREKHQNKKERQTENIIEKIILNPMTFSIGIAFFIIIGRNNIDLVIILSSIAFCAIGYIVFMFLVLMKEIPIVKQLRVLEKKIGSKFININ